MEQQLTVAEWLVKNGFEQDGQAQDPFTHLADFAEYDPRREECFEAFPYYEAVKGTLQSPGPTLIYGARGGGKSALRCQIFSELNHSLNSDSDRVLAVTYDKFDPVLDLAEKTPDDVTLRMHTEQIVGLIVAKLFDFSLAKPSRANLRALNADQKWLLYWYIVNFAKHLHYREINRRLGKLLGSRYYLTPENIVKVLVDILKTVPKAGESMGTLSEILTDWPLRQATPKDIPGQDLLMDIVDICKAAEIDAIYVLIDNLDASNLTDKGDDFEPAFHVIRSLCTTPALHIQYIPDIIFKIFMPEEIYPLGQNVFRPELGERHIRWHEPLPSGVLPLVCVLRKRMEVYSNGLHKGLRLLVEDELAPYIDHWFVEQAKTPRELLVLGRGMLESHFAHPSTEPLLTRADWEAACQELEAYRQHGKAASSAASAGNGQKDPNFEAIQNLERQLEMARQALDIYEVQAAGYTKLTIPAHLVINLEQQREKVADLEDKLQEKAGNKEEGKR